MHMIPLVLGILAVGAGIAMVGFGIPINEFGTGNTLIAAGTTAIVGGFVLLGLWPAVLQLRRLTRALEPRAAWPGSGAADAARAQHGEEAVDIPTASELLHREPDEAPEPDYESAEPAPSPRDTRAGTRPREHERRESLQKEQERSGPERLRPPRSPRPGSEQRFDAIWPSERPRRPEPTSNADQSLEAAEDDTESTEPSAAFEDSPPAILKSGVINGMAYTLYSDGSIEAELPQGTLRFDSVDELRGYLADNA